MTLTCGRRAVDAVLPCRPWLAGIASVLDNRQSDRYHPSSRAAVQWPVATSRAMLQCLSPFVGCCLEQCTSETVAMTGALIMTPGWEDRLHVVQSLEASAFVCGSVNGRASTNTMLSTVASSARWSATVRFGTAACLGRKASLRSLIVCFIGCHRRRIRRSSR